MIDMKLETQAIESVTNLVGKECRFRDSPVSIGHGAQTAYPSGELFVNKGVIEKSDYVVATPWWFTKEKYVNNDWSMISETVPDRVSEACGRPQRRVVANAAGVSAVRRGDLLRLPTGPNDESIALIKAHANLRRAMASIPMLIAERKETVKTIGKYSTFVLNNVITLQRKDLKRWMRELKRHKGKPEKLKRIAQDIANSHLEFVFGVLPVIGDIEGLCELLVEEQLDFRTGRGRHTSQQKTVTKRLITSSGAFPRQMVEEVEKRTRHSVRIGLRYDIDLRILNDASRLGFNPIYTWYDLTPLSFVVGWFSNLNSWLQSLDPVFGLTYRTGYCSIRAETNCKRSITSTPLPTTIVSGSGEGFGERIEQTRKVYKNEPGLPPPTFLDNYGVFAAIATVSLAVQRKVKTAEIEIAKKPFRYRRGKPRNLPPIRYKP